MTKRIKKAPVKPEQRRDWLRKYEEEGDPLVKIAKEDGYDVRTVGSQIALAKDEREYREAKTLVRRQAVEKHYDDLIKLAGRLNPQATGTESGGTPDDEFLTAALREHLPRSPIWGYLAKITQLQSRVDELRKILDTKIEKIVTTHPKIISFSGDGLKGVPPGVTTLLVHTAKQWSQGNTAHTLKDSLVIENAEGGMTAPRLGFAHMGLMEPEVARAKMPEIQRIVEELETTMKSSAEYQNLVEKTEEVRRAGAKLREELAVIRLRRVIPGHCRYCPV